MFHNLLASISRSIRTSLKRDKRLSIWLVILANLIFVSAALLANFSDHSDAIKQFVASDDAIHSSVGAVDVQNVTVRELSIHRENGVTSIKAMAVAQGRDRALLVLVEGTHQQDGMPLDFVITGSSYVDCFTPFVCIPRKE